MKVSLGYNKTCNVMHASRVHEKHRNVRRIKFENNLIFSISSSQNVVLGLPEDMIILEFVGNANS